MHADDRAEGTAPGACAVGHRCGFFTEASRRTRRITFLAMALLAAVFNLNHPAHTVDWHFIHLSVANVIVIGLMLAVFVLAIALPFPGAARRRRAAK